MPLKDLIKIYTVLSLLIGFIIFTHAFLIAYTTDSKEVIISIDKYGDSYFEFIFIGISILIVITGLILMFVDQFREDKENGKE